jgi:quercetin 2,3-dioxygenase
MEIVTIPWMGTLAHKDSMGNIEEIKKGEVQIMSAGTGITHSEFNASKTDPAGIFQIWVLPKKRGIAPRYGQKAFPASERENKFQLVVSPNGDDAAEKGPVWINQDAYFSLGNFTKGQKIEYHKYIPTNLVYTFVISGSIESDEIKLETRDGYGSESANQNWIAQEDSELLIIEVPTIG